MSTLEIDDIVYRALVIAADQGAPCPGGRTLAKLLGGRAKDEYVAYRAMTRLARSGRLIIERREKPNRRRITIVESCKRTDWSTTGSNASKGRSPVERLTEAPMPKMPDVSPWVGDCFGPHNLTLRARP